MPDRWALATGAVAAYLVIFPLAAIADRVFGVDAAGGPLVAMYAAGMGAAFAVGTLAMRRAPARDRGRRAVAVGAVAVVTGAIVIALVPTPSDPAAAAAYPDQVAGLAVLVAVPSAVVWWRRRASGSQRGGLALRAAGALGAAALSAVFSVAWVFYLVDAFIDVATPAGTVLTALLFVLASAAAAAAVWTAPDGRRATARALAVAGVPGIAGPLLLYALRVMQWGRAGAAIRADWSEENALLGVFVVGGMAIWALVAVVAARLVAARSPRPVRT